MEIRIKSRLCTTLVALALFAAPMQQSAEAGPTIVFGDEEQGVLRIDYKAQFQMITRNTGSGPNKLDRTSTAHFRRNRLAFLGAWEELLSIYVQTDFVEDRNVGTINVGSDFGSYFSLLDAQLRFNFDDALKVRVGKFKANFSRENLEDCYQPLTLDRSLFLQAPFVVSRDIGVAAWGNFFEDKVQYKIDVVEGRKADSVAPDSKFRFTGRVHLSLLDPEKGYGYKGTYRGTKEILTIGAAYQFEPDVLYGNAASQADVKDYRSWTADIFAEYPVEDVGTFTFSAAYMDVDLDGAYKGVDPEPEAINLSGERNGYYVKAAYMFPNLPLQVFGRVENWSFAKLENDYNQGLGWYGAGLNYYFRDQNLKVTVEYAKTDFDKEATNADFNTVKVQLQVIF